MKERTNYLLFESSDAFQKFLTRKINPTVKDDIEYCTMEKFNGNKILFTADHARTGRIPLARIGPNSYAGVGDTNTGILAQIGSYYLKSAYIFPHFIRTDADPSRPTKDLGKGLQLFVKQKYSGEQAIYIPIHKNKNMMSKLLKYHEIIDNFNPNAILSIHGISLRRPFDIIFGFGKDYRYIGGKKNAFEFKNRFTEELGRVFGEIGLKANLDIRVSTWKFMGHRNYVLSKHILQHNENSDKKRLGMQVEFNRRGRSSEHDEDIPTLPYQIAVQVLGDVAYRWKNGNFHGK